MATWVKKPFRYVLIGLHQGSAAKPYEIVVTTDTRDDRKWVSCNCPSYIRGSKNRGLQNWERSCKHTVNYTVEDLEIDFDGGPPAQPKPVWKQEGRIGFVKPMLPAKWEDHYAPTIFDNLKWFGTVKVDGHRCEVVKQPYGSVEMFSRGGKRMLSVEKAFQDLPLSVGTMLDCELVVGDLSACDCESRGDQRAAFEAVAHFRSEHPDALHLVVLDVLFSTGLNVMGEQYWFRWDQASAIVKALHDDRVKMVETKPLHTRTAVWLAELVSRGKEGAVFWNIDASYSPGIRSSSVMLKWKPGRTETQDVVVVGILPPTEKGTLHRLAYGYADGKQVGVVPGVQGTPEELEQHVGEVVELSCHEVLPSGALLYPEFVRWRPDKTKEECTGC